MMFSYIFEGVGHIRRSVITDYLQFFAIDPRYKFPVLRTYKFVPIPVEARLLHVIQTNAFTGDTPNPFYVFYMKGNHFFC